MLKDIVSPFVKEAPPYKFGVGDTFKPLRPGVTDVYSLHKNENPFGVSTKAQEAMRNAIPGSNRYPDITAFSLRKKLAAKHLVSPDNIQVVQGATSALGFLADMLVRPGNEVLVSSPTYPNYLNVTKKNGGRIVQVPMDADYRPDFEAMLAAVTGQTRIAFVCNPNNPTGTVCDDQELLRFLQLLPEHVLAVVDEAYFEYVDIPGYHSMIPEIPKFSNLAVVKTFSKIYGMAGCRLGYVLGSEELIRYLNVDSVGYCCNAMALAGAEAALDDTEYLTCVFEENRRGRDFLTQAMRNLGFKVWDSQSNFIFFDPKMPPDYMAGELYTYGVHIRGDFEHCRISVGTKERNERAAAAMKEIVETFRKEQAHA